MQDEETIKIWAMRDKEDARIVRILNKKANLHLKSVWDLINPPYPAYTPETIPVLLELLSETEEGSIKEGMIRALGVKSAGENVVSAMISEINNYNNDEQCRFAAANTISIIKHTDSKFYSIFVAMINNKKNIGIRGPLLEALVNIKKDEETERILIQSLDYPDTTYFALTALSKAKAKKAIPHIKKLLTHKDAYIRNKVKKVLAKLEQ